MLRCVAGDIDCYDTVAGAFHIDLFHDHLVSAYISSADLPTTQTTRTTRLYLTYVPAICGSFHAFLRSGQRAHDVWCHGSQPPMIWHVFEIIHDLPKARFDVHATVRKNFKLTRLHPHNNNRKNNRTKPPVHHELPTRRPRRRRSGRPSFRRWRWRRWPRPARHLSPVQSDGLQHLLPNAQGGAEPHL